MTPITMLYWSAPLLAAGFAAGLAYFILHRIRSGAADYSRHYSESTQRDLADMFLFIPARRVMQMAAGLSSVFFLIGFGISGGFSTTGIFFRGMAAGLLLAGLGWNLPRQLLAVMKQRRLLRFNEQLADALVAISNSLKAGFSIVQAFEAVTRNGLSPIAQEFNAFLHETRVGVRFEDALAGMKNRVQSEDLALAALAIETARQTGGNLTEVLENIAATIRERQRIERRIRTLTAMGRLQGIVVGLLPIALGLAMWTIDPPMMIAFFRSPLGWAAMVVFALLEIAGFFLIRRIVRIEI